MPVYKKNRGDGRDEKGKFAEGNELWQMAKNAGRPLQFETPEELWENACEYFNWVDNNPLFEEIIVNSSKEGIQRVKVPKKRPYTIGALCIFMGTSSDYIKQFNIERNPEFSPIIKHIKEIIYNQKFEGAASGFFNANIIARDLGLADKSEFKGKVKTGLDAYSEEELKDRLDQLNSFEDDLD